MSKDRWRLLIAVAATVLLVVPLAWLWQQSRLPGEYSVMDMGYADYGGGPQHGPSPVGAGMDMSQVHGPHGHQVSVADLVPDPHRKADVVIDLVARKQRVRLASGATIDGYTINGQTPGPLIEVHQGQLVEVHLTNASVPDGITLHWHGVDVPDGEDGVAGVTQDAVRVGQEFTYRFVADRAGTYWYHSHQVSHEQVIGGLLGPLVVQPPRPVPQDRDVVALMHTYDGIQTINGRAGDTPVSAPPGSTVRVRAIDTDNGPLRVWAGTPYRVVAIDGNDEHGPTPVTGKALTLPAGGRADLEVRVPADGSAVRVDLGAATSLVIGPKGAQPPPATGDPGTALDLLRYGTPAPLGFDPAKADRHFDYRIGRRPGFFEGKPGLWWTINGHMWPDVPMFVVDKGDIVSMTISNSSGDVHPMHLHGHRAVVLSKNGEKLSGSPWWFDTLNVEDGDTFVIAFVADNPGIWMDHCHNLQHAAQGLVAHLMYEGVTTPYMVGGPSGNEPE